MSPHEAIAALWAAFAPVVSGRVEILETFANDVADHQGDPAGRADAMDAAHKLAGALGTYGKQGSDVAAMLESVLRRPGPVEAGDILPLVRQLRAAVDPA